MTTAMAVRCGVDLNHHLRKRRKSAGIRYRMIIALRPEKDGYRFGENQFHSTMRPFLASGSRVSALNIQDPIILPQRTMFKQYEGVPL